MPLPPVNLADKYNLDSNFGAVVGSAVEKAFPHAMQREDDKVQRKTQ